MHIFTKSYTIHRRAIIRGARHAHPHTTRTTISPSLNNDCHSPPKARLEQLRLPKDDLEGIEQGRLPKRPQSPTNVDADIQNASLKPSNHLGCSASIPFSKQEPTQDIKPNEVAALPLAPKQQRRVSWPGPWQIHPGHDMTQAPTAPTLCYSALGVRSRGVGKFPLQPKQPPSILRRTLRWKNSVAPSSPEGSILTRSSTSPVCGKRITFRRSTTVYDFEITDHEREGSWKWWSRDEIDKFRRKALRHVPRAPRAPQRSDLCGARKIPAIAGRAPTSRRPKGPFSRQVFGRSDEFVNRRDSRRSMNVSPPREEAGPAVEVRSVLIVHHHERILSLFARALKRMLPCAYVATARSSEEAIARIEEARDVFTLSKGGGSSHGFDMIVVDECLHGPPPAWRGESVTGKVASGSSFLSSLVKSACKLGDLDGLHSPLLVGVSTRPMQDGEKLESIGADCVWSLPPTAMDETLRNKLLGLLADKMNAKAIADI